MWFDEKDEFFKLLRFSQQSQWLFLISSWCQKQFHIKQVRIFQSDFLAGCSWNWLLILMPATVSQILKSQQVQKTENLTHRILTRKLKLDVIFWSMETYSLNSSFVKSLNFENDKNITIFQLPTFTSKFSIQEAVHL